MHFIHSKRDLALELALQPALENKDENWNYNTLDFVLALPSKQVADNQIAKENLEKTTKQTDDIVSVFSSKLEDDENMWTKYISSAAACRAAVDNAKREYKRTQRAIGQRAAENFLGKLHTSVCTDEFTPETLLACLGKGQREQMLCHPQHKHPVAVLVVDANMMDSYSADLSLALSVAKSSPLNVVVLALMPYSNENKEAQTIQTLPLLKHRSRLMVDCSGLLCTSHHT